MHAEIACAVAYLRGGGPPLAALLWGRHYGLNMYRLYWNKSGFNVENRGNF